MAGKLVSKIEKTKGWGQALGCGDADIQHAQEDLGMVLPSDYKNLVKEYGAITFPEFRWFGLNVVDMYDVVVQTKAVKERVLNFPEKHFVLQVFYDETCAIVNESGEVFHLTADSCELVSKNLVAYFDRCLTDPVVKPVEPSVAEEVENKPKKGKTAPVKAEKKPVDAPESAVDW